MRFVATGAAVTLAFAAALVSTSSVALASPVVAVTAVPSDAGDIAATYTVHFYAQADLSSNAGSWIKLTAPTGTVFPVSASDYTISDNGGTAVQVSATPSQLNPNDITLQVPADLTNGDALTLVANNVGNPTTSSTSYSIDIADSEGGDTTASPYTIDPGIADAATTTITTSPSSVVADGATTSTITVQAKDANGNNLLVGGSEVFISTNLGALNTALGNDNNDGTYTVTISSTTAGNATINGTIDGSAITATAAVSFTPVGGIAQTITFTQPSDISVAGGMTALNATSDSGLTVTFSSATPSTCSVSGDTVIAVSVGLCTINANQSGNGTYAPATTTPVSIQVVGRSQTISFSWGGAADVSDGPLTVAATSDSGLTVTFTSASPGVCSVSGSTVTLLHVGTCLIDADQAGSSSYAAAATVEQSYVVSAGTQTITFAQSNDIVYGGTVTLNASSDSGLPVTFSNGSPSVCSLSGNIVTGTAVGTCSIQADQAGNNDYAAAGTISDAFNVNQAGQTITFVGPMNTALTGGPVTVTATATSTDTVTFSSETQGVCTVTGDSVSLLEAGTCTIDADQAGDDNYNAAATVPQTFQVTQGVGSISFTQTSATALTAGPVDVGGSGTSSNAVEYSTTSTGVCTVDPASGSVTLVGVGTCAITINQAADSNYSGASATDSFIVTQGVGSISFTQTPATALTAGPVSVTASGTSSNGLSYSTLSTGVCTVNSATGIVTLVGVGTCAITINQPGDANYSAAAASDSFTVTQATQTITFTQPGATFYTGSVTLVGSANSGLGVTFTSATTAVCTVSGTTVTAIAVGTCTIHADQAGNSSYAAAPTVTHSFNVAQATQAITFTQPSNTALTAGSVTVSATADSGLTVTFSSATTPVCTVSGTTVTLVAVGTCTINADQAGTSNYAAATRVVRSFSVAAAGQTITFTQPSNTAFGAGPVTMTATTTSGLTVTFTSATTGICTVTGASVTLVAAGTCTINADQAGSVNFAAAPTVARSFTVAQGAQEISFTGPASTALTGGPVTVTATATSGLTVTFTSVTTGVCTVSGASVTLLTAGTCTLHADQAGNANWAAALTVPQSFTVTAGAQTITFTQPANHAYGTGPITASATATSGLTVAFTSTTTAVCTVSGASVTLFAAGTCTLHADQAGSGNWAAATTVPRSFTITSGAQTITFTAPADTALNAGPVTVTGTASSELPVAFTSTTTAICTASANSVTLVAVGTCTINADQEGDGDYAGATTVSRSFAVTAAVAEGGTPAAPVAPIVTATRIGGADRDDTAAQLSTAIYPTAGSAAVVVLARDDIYADGLTGSPLANALNGALLITPTATLSASTLAALQHLLPAGGTVICLGGNDAIDPSVLAELTRLGYNVQRIAGADRYETATLIATRIFAATTITHIYLATGENFADALSAAGAAGLNHGVVLLTANTTMPAVTKAWIVAHPGLAVTAIGGAAATADPAATAIVGADRYATAAQVAASVAPTATGIVLATGTAFPDGLAGAAYAVHNGFSLLLVNPQATVLGAAQVSYLQTASATVSTVLTVGGTAAVPAAATGLITDGLS